MKYLNKRENIIIKHITGKRVLDIGSIGQSGEYCLWKLIENHARYLVGVDLEKAEIKNKELFSLEDTATSHHNDKRIVYGNMETLDLKEKFDVIIAGDVIEHISNPGLFLDNIKRHLEDNGKLILTTPNAKWITVFLRPNPTHVLWHDIYTMRQLLKRHGFKIEHYYYYYGNKPHYSILIKPILLRQSLLVIANP
jgi:2-polyprenyl-3-methyl-5-hydroxy-6-metoxy-1,4-benzoquinol methylase